MRGCHIKIVIAGSVFAGPQSMLDGSAGLDRDSRLHGNDGKKKVFSSY
jgi:hypothetical protein